MYLPGWGDGGGGVGDEIGGINGGGIGAGASRFWCP